MSLARVAVLTVSDTASADASADRSGPAIRDILASRGYECAHTLIVPDDETRIREAVRAWCAEDGVDWVLTTGGTGFGVRDRTPEAIRPLLEREASGLVHLLLSTSLQHTPLAALSRPVAGTIGNTLVVTLPGSVKAVRENLDALLAGGVAEHALDLVRGGSGRRVHAGLGAQGPAADVVQAQPHAHHHHHHHHHDHGHGSSHRAPVPLSHDPSLPVSARHRESPYPLVTVDDALSMILAELRPLPAIELPVTAKLRGHVLAEDVYAPCDIPPTQTTSVDGYALRSTDPPGVYDVVGPKTHALTTPLPAGTVFRINTGGPLPAGADAVLMVEDTRLHAARADGEEAAVATLAQAPAGENLRAPGSDVRAGTRVLGGGDVLRAGGGELGTLAFVGRAAVAVFGKPVVALLSTGNELLDLQAPQPLEGDGWGGIYDTNRPSLQAVLEGMGYEVVDLGIVPDDLDAHIAALKKGLECADLLLTTGGTSMGAGDLLKPVIERHLDGTIHFGRVKVKPGKPTTFGTLPPPPGRASRVPIFALPGNPASALVTFYLFVLPALRRLGGWSPERCHLPRVRVQLHDAMRLDSRPEFHRVIIKAGPTGLTAFSTGGQRSSRVASLSGANGLVALPPREANGPDKLEAGTIAEAVIIGELEMQ